MKFYIHHHQHKGKPYKSALLKEGHEQVVKFADIALFDRVTSAATPNKLNSNVQQHFDMGAKIVVYPHAAILPWWYDGMTYFPDVLSCLLVLTEEQKRITKEYIVPHARVEAAGFPYCTQKRFSKPKEIKKILFAPTHPAGKNIRPNCRETNRNVFRELKRIQRAYKAEITIRYIGEMGLQGIKPYQYFNYSEATPDGGTKEIDEADVVIAEGTFMYLAVARGKPVVAMEQHVPMRSSKSSIGWKATHWDDYGEEIAYPINYVPGQLWDLLHEAAKEEQKEWRKKFIGSNLKSENFSDLMEDVLKNA